MLRDVWGGVWWTVEARARKMSGCSRAGGGGGTAHRGGEILRSGVSRENISGPDTRNENFKGIKPTRDQLGTV